MITDQELILWCLFFAFIGVGIMNELHPLPLETFIDYYDEASELELSAPSCPPPNDDPDCEGGPKS